MSIAEKIKLEMRKRKVTAPELSCMTGISLMTIQNILQQRSKKLEYLEKISAALDLSLDQLINDDTPRISNKIDLQKYSEAVKVCLGALNDKNLIITKSYLENFIHTVYLYIVQKQPEYQLSLAYAEGFLERDISSKKVNYEK